MTPSEKAPRADIERVDKEGFHGWVVTVWKNGIEHQRRFDEAQYGSPSAAFAAAVRFRNRIVSGARWAEPSNRKTGIPGISVGRVLTSAGRYVRNYKTSCYAADGSREMRVLSWLKYGKEEALRLAKQALNESRQAARRARRLRKKRKPDDAESKPRLKSLLDQSKATKHENVRRVDHNHFHGYVVRVTRVRSCHAKYFSDTAEGGRRSALARALEYRDALLAELPPPVRIHRKTSNSTGIPGVSLVYDRTRSGRIVPRFVAYWHNADGCSKKKSYSTLEHGFGGAERKAIQARNGGVAQLVRHRKATLLEKLEQRKRERGSRPSASPVL